MSFRTYRQKGTIEAEVVERDMLIPDASVEGGQRKVSKGDYLTLVDGVGKYEEKAEFESKYEPVRQKKQVSSSTQKTTSSNKKNKATAATQE